jgi:hypothetical protein
MASKQTRLRAQLRRYEEKYQELRAQLAETGYLYDGSVGRQWLRCGKENCACASDPARRHGPYAYWTTKKKGRTVSRRLGPQEADLLERWVANRRAMERIKDQMIRLSRKVAPILLELGEDAPDA